MTFPSVKGTQSSEGPSKGAAEESQTWSKQARHVGRMDSAHENTCDAVVVAGAEPGSGREGKSWEGDHERRSSYRDQKPRRPSHGSRHQSASSNVSSTHRHSHSITKQSPTSSRRSSTREARPAGSHRTRSTSAASQLVCYKNDPGLSRPTRPWLTDENPFATPMQSSNRADHRRVSSLRAYSAVSREDSMPQRPASVPHDALSHPLANEETQPRCPIPATTIHWTSPSTRKQEYAEIDKCTRGFHGLWRKIAPKWCMSSPQRFYSEEDSDAGSVRRYRLEMPDDEEADEEDDDEKARKKPPPLRRSRRAWSCFGC